MTTPPKAGARPTVRVDQEMSDDLAVLMRPGLNVTDAVRHAVSIVADAYRNAWAMGVVPDGVQPRIVGHDVMPSDARPTPSDSPQPASSAPSDTPRRPRPTGGPTPSDGPRPTRPTQRPTSVRREA